MPDAAVIYAALNLAADGTCLTFRKAVNGPEKDVWVAALIEELRKLLGGNVMHAIHLADQPQDRRSDTTYGNPQVKEKLDSAGNKTARVRLTAGGDKIHYRGDVTARCAEMEVVKLLIHSVASDRVNKGPCHYITMDMKDFYIGADLPRSEYIRIPLKLIPPAVLEEYKLHNFICKRTNTILFEITKCLWGLPQAGLLSQQRLIKHLAKHGYHQDPNVPCLFSNASKSVTFTLVVDDFGVKCTRLEDAEHLQHVLEELYEVKVNWSGSKYLGFTITFDDEAQTVSLSMPDYIPKLLQRFSPTLCKGAATPGIYTPPSYGKPNQVPKIDRSKPLDAAATKRLQEIVGAFLFYARAVDPTMLHAVNRISSMQAHPTIQVMAEAERLLAYAYSHQSHEIVYHACDMVYHAQSDASHLSRTHSRSVAGGIHFFGNRDQPDLINGPLLCTSGIIPTVVAAASEAEYASLFIAGQHGAWIRTIAVALGYEQPTTVIFSDNECAVGIASDTVQLKRSKALDMRYHWIRDRVRQGEFKIVWRAGKTNLADFFTKSLPTAAHNEKAAFLVRSRASQVAH
jgi:hypothetical protein